MGMMTLKQSIRQDEKGATAIEFAFFVVPFAFLLIGIVEFGMMFTAASLLQSGTDSAARVVRTGQAQESGDAQGAFEDLLCAQTSVFIRCADLMYQVIRIDDSDGFSDAANDSSITEPTIDEFGNMPPSTFDAGGPNSLIIVRVAYRYPLMSPFVGPVLADRADGKRLIMATAIIQNEPYEF
jgi:Flp pilus assembly protein TadG